MYTTGFVLKSMIDFRAAITFKKHIEVWQNGQLIDCGGIIEEHTEHTVIINGGRYLKENSEFIVR